MNTPKHKIKKTFLERLKDGYESAKKPLAYIIMLSALLLQSLPSDFIPEKFQGISYTVMILILSLILLEILFTIYEKVTEEKATLNIIKAGDLYKAILGITLNEKTVSIKYIGIAGRNGWNNVLVKLLNEHNPDSLVANRTKFNVDVALLSPDIQKKFNQYKRFSSVDDVSEEIVTASKYLSEISQAGSSLNIHHYDFMPNMLGFLVNDNYLFVTYTFWESMHGRLTLRGGGADYFVYNKSDKFGGQEVIRRFNGWFNYISDPNSVEIESE